MCIRTLRLCAMEYAWQLYLINTNRNSVIITFSLLIPTVLSIKQLYLAMVGRQVEEVSTYLGDSHVIANPALKG